MAILNVVREMMRLLIEISAGDYHTL